MAREGKQRLAAAIKTNDRERMADDLKALGLYATANDVRASRAKLTEGVAHVRDYCLPTVLEAIEERRARNAESPAVEGTAGFSMLGACEARRNFLQGFLDDWAAYDLLDKEHCG